MTERDRLASWMDEAGLPGHGEDLEIRHLSGGASNEILALRRGSHRMVLRRPPRDLPEGRSETMLREHRVLAALAGSDVPHPAALAVCDDPSVIGCNFYVMAMVDGWSPMDGTWPAPFDTDLDARAGLGIELVDGIARLARVDWRAAGLDGFGRPEGFHDRQVDRWLAHLDRFRFRELPGLDAAAAWLRTHRPRHWSPGILHGDYQFANVMYHHGGPARLAAIVDWEMATIGDPLLDLGWVLNGWPADGAAPSPDYYVDLAGMPSRSELLHRYASVSGRDVDWADYYVVLARFKLAVVLEGGYARVVDGTATNPKMAAFGRVVLDQATAAAELAARSPLPATS